MTDKIRAALVSVSDKEGVVELCRFLHGEGVTILSTGGTAALLKKEGIPVKEVSEHTGFPEIMDGRVKTLHPKIHGGLLGKRGDKDHLEAMDTHDITPIDLAVINLYPFEAAVARGASEEECIGNIDIGGPSMIRSAAKNHADVTVVVDPADYKTVMASMREGMGATTIELRGKLAAMAFSRTAAYDAVVSRWFYDRRSPSLAEPGREGGTMQESIFPPYFSLVGTLRQSLRYGENPHQRAAFYQLGDAAGSLAAARQAQGRELSYNNINDASAALELVREFSEPAVAIIKHANPCGVACGRDMPEAYRKAFACDPQSAFGGIIALNRPLDKQTAEAIAGQFAEVILAPDADEEALAVFKEKKNLRLLLTGDPPAPFSALAVASVSGGILVQGKDHAVFDEALLKIPSKRQPTEAELQDMRFAFTVAKHVRSNAIVLARDGRTLGIGAGQMSRIDSVRIAVWKAGEAGLDVKGAALASDAFFPFDDNVHSAAAAGITAIIQPGGSIRDAEVIAAADSHGMAMVFTGVRHFRH